MWKYIESRDASGKELSEEEMRQTLGVTDPACPFLELEGGWCAAWCAQPRESATAYDKLSRKPKDETLAKAYPSV